MGGVVHQRRRKWENFGPAMSPHGEALGPRSPIAHRPRGRNILRTVAQFSPPETIHVCVKIQWFSYMFKVFVVCTFFCDLRNLTKPLCFDLLPLGPVRDPCLTLQIRSQTSRVSGFRAGQFGASFLSGRARLAATTGHKPIPEGRSRDRKHY